MNELINHFLKKPVDQAYIKKVAFQYFDSNYKTAEFFLYSLKEEKMKNLHQKSSINFWNKLLFSLGVSHSIYAEKYSVLD